MHVCLPCRCLPEVSPATCISSWNIQERVMRRRSFVLLIIIRFHLKRCSMKIKSCRHLIALILFQSCMIVFVEYKRRSFEKRSSWSKHVINKYIYIVMSEVNMHSHFIISSSMDIVKNTSFCVSMQKASQKMFRKTWGWIWQLFQFHILDSR